jgi:hypothetical protein
MKFMKSGEMHSLDALDGTCVISRISTIAYIFLIGEEKVLRVMLIDGVTLDAHGHMVCPTIRLHLSQAGTTECPQSRTAIFASVKYRLGDFCWFLGMLLQEALATILVILEPNRHFSTRSTLFLQALQYSVQKGAIIAIATTSLLVEIPTNGGRGVACHC